MNKTAKEMFEELGYEKYYSEHDLTIIYRKHIDIVFKPFINEIEIGNVYKSFYNYKSLTIDYNLLQAINKQVEELGWNNE